MTAKAGATPVERLDQAIRQHGTVIEAARDALSASDALETVIESGERLEEARKAVAADAPDVGGTTLTLTLDEARLVRAALRYLADNAEGWEPASYDGPPSANEVILGVRKRINEGVVRNAERRSSKVVGVIEETYYRPRPAEAATDSDDGEEAS